jgi:hypothetical protein
MDAPAAAESVSEDRKARDAELAWRKHRGERFDRVPEAAQRAARNWKRSLQPNADAMASAIANEKRVRQLAYGAFF